MSDTPRVYIASLSDYNAGRLHGKWFDVTDFADGDDLYAAVKEQVLDTSPEPIAEEWAIHDYEGFGDYRISEYESFDAVVDLANAIEEHGPQFIAYIAHVGGLEYAENFEEAYCGQWDSEQDYAEELVDDLGYLADQDFLATYFDYEKFTRDLFMSDYFSVDAGLGNGVYVFRHV